MSFSRSAIDLALEQTVNRDATSPMRGIVGFHYSHNAIRRWCITSTKRGMYVRTAVSGCIRNNRTASNAVTGELNWKDGRQRMPFSMQSQNRVTLSHDQHQHMLAF